MKLTTKLTISIIIISLFSLYVFEIKYNMMIYDELKDYEENIEKVFTK